MWDRMLFPSTSHREASQGEMAHGIAQAVLEIEGVSHQVIILLDSSDGGIRSVTEAEQATRPVTDNDSERIAALAETIDELSIVLRLVGAEWANNLHNVTNEKGVCTKYCTWK
jgi:hypothetical protein